MAAPLPLRFNVPAADEAHNGRIVTARTLVGYAGAEAHLMGLHCAGFAPVSAYQAAHAGTPGAGNHDYGWQVGEVEDESHAIAFYVPVGVDLLHISAWVLAYSEGGTDTPEVTIAAEDSGGAPIDEGMTWTRPASMAGAEMRGQNGAFYLRPFRIESLARFKSSDPTTGPTGPRHLSVGAKEGEVVVITVETTKARLVALHLWPVVEALI